MSRRRGTKYARRKQRLTVTVDPELIAEGSRAVASGHADSLSSWVNLALVERVAKEQRRAAMAEAIATYEAEFGEISSAELARQARVDRASAVVVRGRKRRRTAA